MSETRIMQSKKPGDACPKCGEPLVRSELGAFYWRGQNYPGAVCRPCNALWPIMDEEIPPLQSRPPSRFDYWFDHSTGRYEKF